ncbi:DMT family transporter [Yoonia sp. 2307UL14-13]|uniref:DMT family transporter n=1 Tax=Yoonia sp. 2307UL14-13 TaxID=3126506 RepID=UPI00309F4B80
MSAAPHTTPSSVTPTYNGAALGILAALLSFSLGPVGVVVQKWLVASFSPFLIIAIQATGGAVLLWLVRWLLFPKASVGPRAILMGLALGILHPGAFMIVYTAASGGLDSVTAVLLLALGPAFIAVGGRLILRETLRPVVLMGICVSLIGLVVLISERETTGANTPMGFALGGLGLLLTSGAMIAGRAFNTGAVMPWFVLAPLQVTGGAIVAWIGTFLTGATLDPAALATEVPAFLYLIVGMTAVSYLAYNFALSRLPTPILGLLAAGAPGIGALAASVIFDTPIGPTAILGIAIILFGAALPPLWKIVAWPPRRRA